MNTFKLTVAAAALCFSAVPALADSIWENIEASGEVVCGGIQNYPPTSFHVGGDLEYAGYGPNICRQIVADLGAEMGKELKVVWKETTWQSVVLDLQAGRIDLFPGMTATEERKKALDMAGPLYRMTDCVIARKGTEPMATWEEYNTADSTFAMVTGTAQVAFLESDVPEAKIMSLKEMSESIMAVQAGRAEYLVQELPICLQTFTTTPNIFEAYTVPKPEHGSPSSAGIRKDDDGRFSDFVQAWADGHRAEGTVAPLIIDGFAAAGMDVSNIPAGIEF
ncbi:transporter substrate-binding domain-containing protein [Salipiger sp. P9]|uniref:transporter substrate-binding domain-containing protein n=1 Tax=Salipiger pentaromativorans TaxID=2943193 RepID=UPI0021579883|nr:transporter substrate-binding domain-containing protein [Salipiger pentaromativorans]MCR8550519.1 transporter substrate-binding domain-containing protein [Salipiger pentaromativorans]